MSWAAGRFSDQRSWFMNWVLLLWPVRTNAMLVFWVFFFLKWEAKCQPSFSTWCRSSSCLTKSGAVSSAWRWLLCNCVQLTLSRLLWVESCGVFNRLWRAELIKASPANSLFEVVFILFIFLLPHCLIASSSAVINVPGTKHVWRCNIFYLWQCLLKGDVHSALCRHITFTSGGQKMGWKALAVASWRWMSPPPRSCRMNDSVFWSHRSVLIFCLFQSSFPFTISPLHPSSLLSFLFAFPPPYFNWC